jgi:hypothetical protein
MKAKTKRCRDHGHPEFELEVGDVADIFWEPLVSYLEESVANGTKFLPGQTVLFGFQILEVKKDGETLTLYAPKEGRMPIEYVPDIGPACLATVRQRYVADSFDVGDELDFPNPLRPTFICSRAGRADETAFIREEPGEDSETGWFAMCADDDHDHNDPKEIECISAWELACRLPPFNLFLGMPVGTMIVFGDDGVHAVLREGAPLLIVPGSFVDALRKEHGWPLPLQDA